MKLKNVEVIGIDTGTETAIAVKSNDELIILDSMHHNDAFEYLITYMTLKPSMKFIIVVEDARKRSRAYNPIHCGNGYVKIKKNELDVLQNVGKIKMCCNLWEHFSKQFEADKRIHFIFIPPIRGATKIKHEEFIKLTKWAGGKTNEHKRDAGMIAWLYNPTVALLK